jgi:hypothetical protein
MVARINHPLDHRAHNNADKYRGWLNEQLQPQQQVAYSFREAERAAAASKEDNVSVSENDRLRKRDVPLLPGFDNGH